MLCVIVCHLFDSLLFFWRQANNTTCRAFVLRVLPRCARFAFSHYHVFYALRWL